jgi:hypothetical protein
MWSFRERAKDVPKPSGSGRIVLIFRGEEGKKFFPLPGGFTGA